MDQVLDNIKDIGNENKAILLGKDKCLFIFNNLTKEELGKKLSVFLSKKKYKLEEGTQIDGVYGRGNKTMRVLFGAFVKRFE